jgi:hypothetical protein
VTSVDNNLLASLDESKPPTSEASTGKAIAGGGKAPK